MLTYDSAVEELYRLGRELAHTAGQPFDLKFIRLLLDVLDHPERRFPSVLVAGTNGKGSTAATLASILQAAGHRTALYTSPHLLRINERIRVDGREIGDAEFAEIYERVETGAQALVASGALPWHPNFFELVTAMAFTYFARWPVDVAVMEVGLGGRLDATNAAEPLLAIIADVALDHQEFLGHTIREIAREKAGIIHPGGTVVTLPQHPEANEAIASRALECGADVINAACFVPPASPGGKVPPVPRAGLNPKGAAQGRESRAKSTAYSLEVMGEQIVVDSPLSGRHQWRNLALAIAAAEQLNRKGVKVLPRDIEAGIRQTHWPGRFQIAPPDPSEGWPEIVLDVAHNPAGAWALRAALSERYGHEEEKASRPLTLVFGAMRDKAFGEIAEILFPLATHLVITRADSPRAATPEEIRACVSRILTNVETEDTVAAALNRGRTLAGEDGVLVITGSLYIVSEALALLPARVARP